MQQLSTRQLAAWLTASDPMPDDRAGEARKKPLLLDVREPWEYELCHLTGSLLMPMQAVRARLTELDADADVVVICHHGVRSRTGRDHSGGGTLVPEIAADAARPRTRTGLTSLNASVPKPIAVVPKAKAVGTIFSRIDSPTA